MGWKIALRKLDGTFEKQEPVHPDKVKADVALRRAIFKEYGKVWITPTHSGTLLHSSVHNIVLGRMEEVEDTFSNTIVNRELVRRKREHNAANSGKTRYE